MNLFIVFSLGHQPYLTKTLSCFLGGFAMRSFAHCATYNQDTMDCARGPGTFGRTRHTK